MMIISEKIKAVALEDNKAERKGKIFSINLSRVRGVAKASAGEAVLVKDYGLQGDAHAGPGEKQVSLLAIESIRKQFDCQGVQKRGVRLEAGAFAENITTEGLNLSQLKIGDRLKIGDDILLEISKIGKECHKRCSIYYKVGDCIMLREGIFAKVLRGARVCSGDEIEVIAKQ